jgi:hypothetical protein
VLGAWIGVAQIAAFREMIAHTAGLISSRRVCLVLRATIVNWSGSDLLNHVQNLGLAVPIDQGEEFHHVVDVGFVWFFEEINVASGGQVALVRQAVVARTT